MSHQTRIAPVARSVLVVSAVVVLAACTRESAPTALTAPAVASTTTSTTSPPVATSTTTSSTSTTTTTTTSTTTTTTTTVPATTVPATTTTAPGNTATPTSVASTTAPSTTQPALEPTDVSASAWIGGTEEGDPEVSSDGVNCIGFYEAMGATTHSSCGEWNAVGGRRVWTVTRGSSERFFAIVWQETSTFNWVPRSRLLEPEPNTWSGVNMIAADIDGGPNEELVSGIRYIGTGGFLDVDVIDAIAGDPQVVGHVDGIDKAVAYTEPNVGVWIWKAEFAATDPGCCPSAYSQFLLRSGSGGWVLEEGIAGAPPDAIPFPSEL